EEVHTVYEITKKRRTLNNGLPLFTPPIAENNHDQPDDDAEDAPLMGATPNRPANSGRPQIHIRTGRFKLKLKKEDAIDWFTAQLQELDDQITAARRKEYRATPLAFVTMNSVTSAQILTQTLMDPNPGAMV